MNTTCLNCGTMLLEGARVCPVCQQPLTPSAPASGGGSWQPPPQPAAPYNAPSWQPRPGQPNFGPPPLGGGSKSNLSVVLVIVMVCFLALLVVGAAGFFIYIQGRKATGNGARGNDNRPVNGYPAPSVSERDSTLSTNTSNPRNAKAPVSGGVLNGKATSLPKPAYPAAARAARASGSVVVQVTVDESGKVTNAKAVSGHSLLQAAAVSAARQARFSPTLLAGQPVKVTGVLTYNFVAE